MALAALVAGSAGAATTRQVKTLPHCAQGYKVVITVIRKQGKTTVVRSCKKKATAPDAVTTPPVTTPAPTPPPVATASTTPTAATNTTPELPTTTPKDPSAEPEDPTTEPEVTKGPVEVHAAIGTGFRQNPLVPNEVTWRFSASATRTVTTDGVAATESVPLPKGELAFFVDGKLECVISAGGAIAGSACTSNLKALGAHEVETIFSGEEASDTTSRTDLISRYPTQTNVQVSIEPVPPQERVVGYTKTLQSYPIYGFEVGRVRITGATSPSGYPTYDCEGLGTGCLIPEGASLASHHGSVSIPLFAKHALNPATEREEWHVAIPAYDEALREEGPFWQYPDESVGAQYLHLVTEPNTTLYEPSSTTVPLDLRGGHYPFYRWMKASEGVGSGPIAAVEGTMRKALTVGTYEKLGGPEYVLKFTGRFYNATNESEGCLFQPRVNGVGLGEHRRPANGSFEVVNGFYNLAPGPYTFEIWVERAAGAGSGSCQITSGYLESYEVLH
jgi:hypothetical protein